MPDKLPIYLLIDASASMRSVLPVLNDHLKGLINTLRTQKTRLGEPLLAVYSFAMNLKEVSPLSALHDIQQADVSAVSFPVRNLKQALSNLVSIISDKDINTLGNARPVLCIITAGAPMPAIDERTASALIEGAQFARIELFNLSNVNNSSFTALTSNVTQLDSCDTASIVKVFQAIQTLVTGVSAAKSPSMQSPNEPYGHATQPLPATKSRQQPVPNIVPPGSAPQTSPDTPASNTRNVRQEQDLQVLTTQNDFLRDRLQSQNAELAKLKTLLATAQKQLQAKNTGAANLETIYRQEKGQSNASDQSTELRKQLEATQKLLQSKDTELAALKTQLETAQKQLQSKDSELTALNTRLAAPHAMPETTRKEIESLNLKVDAWYRKAQEFEAKLKTSQTQCDTTQKQLADTKKQLADTQKLLEGQKAASVASTAIQADLDKANATIRDLQAKLKVAEPYLANMAKAEAENKAQQDYLKQREQEREQKRKQKKDQDFEDLFGLGDAPAGKGFSL